MNTDSLYLAFVEEGLYDCICPEKKLTGKNLEKMSAEINLGQIQKQNFVHEHVVKKHVKREPGLFKKNSGVWRYYSYLGRLIVAMETNRDFKTINHMVATYEQSKKGLSYFYPKRQVQMTEHIQNLGICKLLIA